MCAAAVALVGGAAAAAQGGAQAFPVAHGAPATNATGTAGTGVGRPPAVANPTTASRPSTAHAASRSRTRATSRIGAASSVANRPKRATATTPGTTPAPPASRATAPPAISAPPAAVAASPAPALAPSSTFVRACGLQLCLAGKRLGLYGASSLGGLGDPVGRVGLAKLAHLNIIRIVNFLDERSPDLAHAPYDPVRWARVDREIATARSAGLHVILDLSTYRNLLANNHRDPYLVEWGPFVSFVAARVNTVTGVRYRNDPTIAITSIAGEVEPLTVVSALNPSTAQLTTFYRRTIAELHFRDPNHLVSSGGLLQLNWRSGIDWKAIFAIPGDDVPAIHVYSTGDELASLPAVAAYARSIGKPWIIEEFGFPQTVGDQARSADFTRVFNEAAARSAAGVLFWNIGPEIVGQAGKTQTYDVNPSTPKTFAVVVANAIRW